MVFNSNLNNLESELLEILDWLKANKINGAFRKISVVNGKWDIDTGGNERRMVAMDTRMKKALKEARHVRLWDLSRCLGCTPQI
jgi:hypothetical protein